MSYISQEDYKNLMSKFQKETPKGILKEALDPVGKEDGDIDNDGDTDKTDKYLLKRRHAVGKAIGKGKIKKEGDFSHDAPKSDTFEDTVEWLDDLYPDPSQYEEFKKAFAKELQHRSPEERTEWIKKFKAHFQDKVEEYGYADNYPGSWGYREGTIKEDYRDKQDNLTILQRCIELGTKDSDWQDLKNAAIAAYNSYKQHKDDQELDQAVEELLDYHEPPRSIIPYETFDQDEIEEESKTGGGFNKESSAKVIRSLGKDRYEIKRPDGKISQVDFYLEDDIEMVDPPYGAVGIIAGKDDKYEYTMEADLVDMGGGDWDTEPDFVTLEVTPITQEGLHVPPLQATGPTISTVEETEMFKLPKRKDTAELDYDPQASRFEPDYMKTPGEDDDDDDDDDNIGLDDDESDYSDFPKNFKSRVAKDKKRYPFLRENSVSNPPFGFDVLSPDERKQLKEYIESIKTIKKEIAKITSKVGKKVKEGDLGGDRTDLVMTKQTMSEMDEKEYDRIESHLDVKLHDAFEKVTGMVVKNLVDEGIPEDMIEMYLKYEIEKKAHEAIMSQHD